MKKSDRIYLLPESGNLYKTNLHCHTTVSDGKFTPEEIKKIYMDRGYHAVAYTDHQICVPHKDLTDEGFVALTGVEIAFGIGTGKSVHVCGISRDPEKELTIPNDPDDSLSKINGGILRLRSENFITTLNHPRWSGISCAEIAEVAEVENIEVANGYEMIQDGYADSTSVYELELRRGRRACPVATDDSHTKSPSGDPGYEYFQGFTFIKSDTLTYDSLITALDSGAYYASTGPMVNQLWLDGNILHVECSPVRGIYVHGALYSHRAKYLTDSDGITCADIDVSKILSGSDYLYVQAVDMSGKRASLCPLWLKNR